MADESIDIVLRLRGERLLAAKLRKASRDVDRLGESGQKSNRSFRALNVELGLVRRSLPMLVTKTVAAAAALGVLAQGVSALASGVVMLSTSLLPLAGTLAALPALGMAAAQGMGVLKFAMGNVMEAVGGLNEDMNLEALGKLSLGAQLLAIELNELKRPLRETQALVQKEFFPGLLKGVREARGGLKGLGTDLAGTGRVLGGLAVKAGQMIGSKGFGADLSTQLRNGNRWIGQMGETVLNLTRAMIGLSIAAAPMVNWIMRGIVGWSRWVDAAIAAGRESGRLQGWFRSARVSVGLLVDIFRDFGGALIDILSVGKPFGDQILGMLADSAAAFREWTDSADGRNSIARWFEESIPAVVEMGRLISALSRGLFTLGAGEHVAPLLRMLRTDLGPVLSEMFTVVTRDFAPVMIELLVNLTRILTALTRGGSGPLAVLVKFLGMVAGGLATVLEKIPGLTAALGYLYGGFLAVKTASWAARGAMLVFSKALGFVRLIPQAALAIRNWGQAFVFLSGRAAAAGLAVGRSLVGMTMTAGAGAANMLRSLGAVAVRWAWLGRQALMWAGRIAGAWLLAMGPVGWVVAAVAAAAILLVVHWDTIRAAATRAWTWITAKGDQVVRWFEQMPSKLGSAVRGLWDPLWKSFRSAMNQIITGWNSLEFGIPPIDPPGPGSFPGVSVGTPNIPLLAAGGNVRMGPGAWITGEAGPELNEFDRGGVRVTPLTDRPPVAGPKRGALSEALKQAPTPRTTIHTNVNLDGRTIASIVDEYAGDAEARA